MWCQRADGSSGGRVGQRASVVQCFPAFSPVAEIPSDDGVGVGRWARRRATPSVSVPSQLTLRGGTTPAAAIHGSLPIPQILAISTSLNAQRPLRCPAFARTCTARTIVPAAPAPRGWKFGKGGGTHAPVLTVTDKLGRTWGRGRRERQVGEDEAPQLLRHGPRVDQLAARSPTARAS